MKNIFPIILLILSANAYSSTFTAFFAPDKAGEADCNNSISVLVTSGPFTNIVDCSKNNDPILNGSFQVSDEGWYSDNEINWYYFVQTSPYWPQQGGCSGAGGLSIDYYMSLNGNDGNDG